MKNLFKIFLLIIISQFIGYFALAGCVCNGQPSNLSQADCGTPTAVAAGCAWTAGSSTAGGTTGGTVPLTNPLTGNATSKSIPEFLGTIISYAMGIIGSLALVMFIYGGATWMLSGGNQEQVSKGKNIVIWAALGIALIFTSYVLVKFVITAISGANP